MSWAQPLVDGISSRLSAGHVWVQIVSEDLRSTWSFALLSENLDAHVLFRHGFRVKMHGRPWPWWEVTVCYFPSLLPIDDFAIALAAFFAEADNVQHLPAHYFAALVNESRLSRRVLDRLQLRYESAASVLPLHADVLAGVLKAYIVGL